MIRAASGDPMSLKKSLQQAIWEVDKDLPVSGADTVEHHLADLVAEPRLYTLLLGVFAGVALILASVGVYGVMSYSVTERTHEIGIRMALGATASNVKWLVMRQGMGPVVAGWAAGLIGALAVGRLVRSLLFDTGATDLATLAGVSAVVLLVAVTACYLPARRATRFDPMEALRYQ